MRKTFTIIIIVMAWLCLGAHAELATHLLFDNSATRGLDLSKLPVTKPRIENPNAQVINDTAFFEELVKRHQAAEPMHGITDEIMGLDETTAPIPDPIVEFGELSEMRRFDDQKAQILALGKRLAANRTFTENERQKAAGLMLRSDLGRIVAKYAHFWKKAYDKKIQEIKADAARNDKSFDTKDYVLCQRQAVEETLKFFDNGKKRQFAAMRPEVRALIKDPRDVKMLNLFDEVVGFGNVRGLMNGQNPTWPDDKMSQLKSIERGQKILRKLCLVEKEENQASLEPLIKLMNDEKHPSYKDLQRLRDSYDEYDDAKRILIRVLGPAVE